MSLDGAFLNRDDTASDLPPEVEAVLLAVWRRTVRDGSGPDLTLPEAAVLLGTSVESVRRRIKAGRIAAFHDERGRVRVRVALPPQDAVPEPHLSELWTELKTAKREVSQAGLQATELRKELDLAHFHRREAEQELQSVQDETQHLRRELETTLEALEHTRTELASMWRVMSSRKQRAGSLADMTDGNEAFDLQPERQELESERSRIQQQIARVRDLSRRRRWPWPQAS